MVKRNRTVIYIFKGSLVKGSPFLFLGAILYISEKFFDE